MRILITNSFLEDRGGTELYVFDLALALLRRGHEPVVFAPLTGSLAEELRLEGVSVVDDLSALAAPPDLIHGHHTAEVAAALLRFPDVPALQVCHAAEHWCDEPLLHPRIVAHVAVDETVRLRVVAAGVPADLISVIFNGVDLERFLPRTALPSRPARALVFSNHATEANFVPVVRQACAAAGLACDVVGAGVDAQARQPELILRNYDIVFAKARCAREAMAVGCAVIACDHFGLGEMVTSSEFDRLNGLNFGRGALRNPITHERVAAEIARYDADDAAKVSARTRAEGGLDEMVDHLLAVYERVLEAPVAPPQDDDYRRWAAALQLAGARRHLLDRAAVVNSANQRTLSAMQGTRLWRARTRLVRIARSVLRR